MSFSSITLEHREKQDHAQKSFLIYALIGSLVIHIGVLAFGLGGLLTDLSVTEDEPIEVTMVEEPTPQVTKTPEAKKPPPPPKVDSGGGGGGGKTQTPIVKQPLRQAPPVQAFKPPIPPPPIPVPKEPLVQPSPLEKFVDNFKVPPTQPPKPVAEAPPIIPSVTPQPEITTPITPPPQSVRTQRLLPPPIQTPLASSTDTSTIPGNNLIGVPKNGLSQGSGNGVGSGIGNGRGNGIGNGVGNGIGNGVGNGSKPGQTIATAPKLPTPTPKPKPKSTRLNRAKDCIKCEIKYPETAQRRGIEGSPEVTIDYDENGHVTNVRLTQPSGKSELDQALMEQAREFVLKPFPGGRVGVRVVASYNMTGSERDRQYQARQRKTQEEARARQRETFTSTTPTQEETPPSNRRKRSLTPSTPETPATNSSPQVTPQGVEPNSSNLSAPSDTLNQSPQNRSENGNRTPRKLNDSSTQQPFQSPSVPTTQP